MKCIWRRLMITRKGANSMLVAFCFCVFISAGLLSCTNKQDIQSLQSVFLSAADSLKVSGLFKEAELAYLAALSQEKDSMALLPSVFALAEVNLLLKENLTAKEFIDRAQFLAEQLNINDSAHQLTLTVLKAEYAYNTQAYEEGISKLERNKYLIRSGDQSMKMRYYLILGSLYRFGRNDYNNAEKYLLQARALLESLYQKSVYHPILFYRLAATARLKSDFDMSINYAHLMLSAIHTLPEPDSSLSRLAYSVLANTYSSLERYQMAITYYDSSILFESTGSTSKTLATILSNKAFAQQQTKQYSKALDTYNTALKVLAADGIENYSDVHMNLAHLHRITGHYDSSLSYYRQVKRYRDQYYLSPSADKGYAYYRYASLLKEIKKTDSSLFYIQKALAEISRPEFDQSYTINPGLQDFIDRTNSVEMLCLKGALLKEKFESDPDYNYLHLSVTCYKLANHVLKLNAAQFAHENSQLININHMWPNLVSGIDVLYQYYTQNPTAHVEDVYDYIVGTKSQLMLSRLNKQSVEEVYLPKEAVAKLRHLKQELAYWQVALNLTTNEKESLTKKIDSLDRVRADYYKQLNFEFPAYANAKIDSIPTLKDMKVYCAENNKTIIDYTWSDEAVYALRIDSAGSEFFNLAKSDAIKSDIDSLMFQLENPSFQHKDYALLSHKLFTTLLEPVLRTGVAEDVIVIADNVLLNVPFDALLKTYTGREKGYKELDYLLHSCKISHALSLASLRKTHKPMPQTGEALAMAYGVHANDPLSLSNSESEIEVLANFSGGEFFSQQSCTKENFLEHANQASIIHLAVHGMADTTNRYTSYLQFPYSNTESKKLYTYELYRYHIPASLVVLSTCESGAGTYEASEGIFSIARGFLSSGTQAVIQSLWKLNDRASLKIFKGFYQHLYKGETFNEGLRLAKQQYLQSSDNYTSHPAYWAGLVFIGNDGIVVLEKDNHIYVWIICVSLVFLTLISLILNQHKWRINLIK